MKINKVSDIFGDPNELRQEIIEIIKLGNLSMVQLASEIGIDVMCLRNFITQKRTPAITTLAKVKKYLELFEKG